MPDTPLLEIKGLTCDFHRNKQLIHAVRGIDLNIRHGEVLGIVGESGSGKSVAMKSIIRLIPPTAEFRVQKMVFDGRDITSLKERDFRHIRGNSISMIFQDPMTSLNPIKRVGDHIADVLMRHRKLSKHEAWREAVEMLRMVSVPSPEERVRQYPHEFSGGMRQRVLIAMALSCNPKMLIADEPTTALDVTIQAQILDLMRDLQRKNNMTVVLITHDLGVVAGMCHRVAVMYCGLIMEEADVTDIFDKPLHPYTQALIRSIPSIDMEDGERLIPIQGQVPSLLDLPPGCPFASRCPVVRASCSREVPQLVEYSNGHFSRCPEVNV